MLSVSKYRQSNFTNIVQGLSKTQLFWGKFTTATKNVYFPPWTRSWGNFTNDFF